MNAFSLCRPEMSRLSRVTKIGFRSPISRMLSTSELMSPSGRILLPTLIEAMEMLWTSVVDCGSARGEICFRTTAVAIASYFSTGRLHRNKDPDYQLGSAHAVVPA
jgi:hypothetical protein